MRTIRYFVIGFVLAGLFTGSFAAEKGKKLTAQQILEKSEEVMDAPKDREAVEKMTLVKIKIKKKKEIRREKVRKMKFYQKGKDKRLVRFLEPADVAGVSFLSLPDDVMYLYLPAFKKVRRIAAHIKSQSFMGSDFSYEDMGEMEFTKNYKAKLISEEAESYVLLGEPRPKADVGYGKIIVEVDKKNFLPRRIEYYNKKKKLLKIMTLENIKEIDGYPTPQKVTMETVKTRHKTILEMEKVKHDQGLSDKIFTKRYLQRVK